MRISRLRTGRAVRLKYSVVSASNRSTVHRDLVAIRHCPTVESLLSFGLQSRRGSAARAISSRRFPSGWYRAKTAMPSRNVLAGLPRPPMGRKACRHRRLTKILEIELAALPGKNMSSCLQARFFPPLSVRRCSISVVLKSMRLSSGRADRRPAQPRRE